MPLLRRHSTKKFRAYRESIELVSKPARMGSMSRNREKLLSIFSALSYRPVTILPILLAHRYIGTGHYCFSRRLLERVSNFCKAKRKKRGARDSPTPYKAYKGAKYGIPDLSCCYRDNGALRVNHRGLPEAPRMVIANRN